MNSEHKWRFWYHKIIYFSKLAICLTFEYMLFPLGNGVRGKIRPIFAQCAPPPDTFSAEPLTAPSTEEIESQVCDLV